MTRTFFRVGHQDTRQGLWYDQAGQFTGLIHGSLDFCKNHALAMDFDPAIAGYVSAVETLDQLYRWFSLDDILELQKHGFFVFEYEAVDFWWYERFAHYVIRQDTSRPVWKHVCLKGTENHVCTNAL